MKGRGAPRCASCQAQITWLVSPSGAWRTYEPKAVDGRTHMGVSAYPVEGRRAWR